MDLQIQTTTTRSNSVTAIVLLILCIFGISLNTFAWMAHPGKGRNTLSLFAGTIAGPGSLDGTFTTGRLDQSQVIAFDSAGNMYSVGSNFSNLRKISTTGNMTTLAGDATEKGTADGTGAAARFNKLVGIVVDSQGNIFGIDKANYTVRKITPAGVVTTFAGQVGVTGVADGTGTAATFSNNMSYITIDGSDNLYVADSYRIRKITPAGVVTLLAGNSSAACTNANGSSAYFGQIQGLVADSVGNVFVTDYSFAAIRKIDTSGNVTTFAGSCGSPGSSDGTGSAARFNGPGFITIDSSDNLFLTDGTNYTIRKITNTAVVTTVVGTLGSNGYLDGVGTAAKISGATRGMARHPITGDIYFSETYYIRKFDSNFNVTTYYSNADIYGTTDGIAGAATLCTPRAINNDSSGNLYVTSVCSGYKPVMISPGQVTTRIGSTASFGAGLVVKSDGTILVTRTNSHRINTSAAVLWGGTGTSGSADGTLTTASFNTPAGLAIDSAQNIYVADMGNHIIRKIDAAGNVTTIAGSAGLTGTTDGQGSAARFNGPLGIDVDASGNLYVTDSNNHTIRKIDPAGNVTTIAGVAGVTGSADGAANSATFNGPKYLTIDPKGNLYVSELYNPLVRKISAAGVVTTFAGTRGQVGARLGPLPSTLDVVWGVKWFRGKLYINSDDAVLMAPAP